MSRSATSSRSLLDFRRLALLLTAGVCLPLMSLFGQAPPPPADKTASASADAADEAGDRELAAGWRWMAKLKRWPADSYGLHEWCRDEPHRGWPCAR